MTRRPEANDRRRTTLAECFGLMTFAIIVVALLVPAMGHAEALKLEVEEATVGEHWVSGKPTVDFILTQQSARALWEFSKKNIDKRAIFRVDGHDVAKVWIIQELTAGRGVLAAESVNEAIALAKRLNSGKAILEVEEDLSVYKNPADKPN